MIGLKFAAVESESKTTGESLSIGTTPDHPFWSVSRQEFVPAGKLELGEQVVTLSGKVTRLSDITPRAGPETVYNLEVEGQHTYFVSSDGVLVHNAKYLRGKSKSASTAGVSKSKGRKNGAAKDKRKNVKHGGSHSEARRSRSGGEVHHTPAASVSPYTRGSSPALWMETADHRLTESWGRSQDAIDYRASQAELIKAGKLRQAVNKDVRNIRELFGNKYDEGIRQMRQYLTDIGH